MRRKTGATAIDPPGGARKTIPDFRERFGRRTV